MVHRHLARLLVPRLQLCRLPTPIEPLRRLSVTLGGPQLFIKRDDRVGLATGGNKSRMLEFIAAAALESNADTLVTRGHRLSNHCRQTAAAAARLGLDCHLVLKGEACDQPRGNEYLARLLGAQIHWTAGDDPEEVFAEVLVALRNAGRRPYHIAYGGAQPLGAVAYVEALREVVATGQHFDRIIVAASSGATQAGLVAGSWIEGLTTRVLGVSVDTPAECLRAKVTELAQSVGHCYGLGRLPIPETAVEVDDRRHAIGYGVVGAGEREAIQLFARDEGLLLDPVYTARAAAVLFDQIRRGELSNDEQVLFLHTGGLPSLFELDSEVLKVEQ